MRGEELNLSPEFSASVESAPDLTHVGVVIPTRNAKSDWKGLSEGLKKQKIESSQILVIDSSSEDGTAELAADAGYKVHSIDRKNFNHGGTRQLGVSLLPWAKIVIFLTQDAVLADDAAFCRLVSAFADDRVGAAYGRQLPRPGAGAIERHARYFNYPAESQVRDISSRDRLGIKAAFLSNSFSAFRVEALCGVGGFPTDVIMAEDALATGKLLGAGWKVAYVAEACVYHSHAFGMVEEFQRYFDTGVYHRREAWLLQQFGRPSGEGKRFVLSELRYLAHEQLIRIPEALVRTGLKFAGYQLGLREASLPAGLRHRLSLHKGYWTAGMRCDVESLP